ncbi:hypothetical protein QBC40DRAFT_321085, partial [Triangularia verruculosa]
PRQRDSILCPPKTTINQPLTPNSKTPTDKTSVGSETSQLQGTMTQRRITVCCISARGDPVKVLTNASRSSTRPNSISLMAVCCWARTSLLLLLLLLLLSSVGVKTLYCKSSSFFPSNSISLSLASICSLANASISSFLAAILASLLVASSENSSQ